MFHSIAVWLYVKKIKNFSHISLIHTIPICNILDSLQREVDDERSL